MDIAFRRRLQATRGGRNFLVAVPPVIAEALNSQDVVFLVKDDGIHLIPCHRGESDGGEDGLA